MATFSCAAGAGAWSAPTSPWPEGPKSAGGAHLRIQVGLPHAGKIVTIKLGDTSLRIIDNQGELIAAVPRRSDGEISRFKAYGTRQQPR